jgi:hypothetical protein
MLSFIITRGASLLAKEKLMKFTFLRRMFTINTNPDVLSLVRRTGASLTQHSKSTQCVEKRTCLKVCACLRIFLTLMKGFEQTIENYRVEHEQKQYKQIGRKQAYQYTIHG